MKYITALFFLLLSFPAFAAQYDIDYAQSSLAFSGEHAGNKFSGKFESWQADIQFDPANLAASRLNVTIDTASAKTGNVMYDGTLPSEDWFAVKAFPKATFISNEIIKNPDGSYTAKGLLTLRSTSLPVSFVFTLSPPDLSTPEVKSTASFALERVAFGIGEKSDPKAEWVSKDIKLDILILAKRV